MDSGKVSAHYLVGKLGQVTEMLPVYLQAYHAGNVFNAQYSNQQSIGIECHYSIGDSTSMPKMVETLTDLVRWLMTEYNIDVNDVVTHREAASPRGRKQDPSFWTDEQFNAWRKTLTMIHPSPLLFSNRSVTVDRLQLILDTRKIKHADTIAASYSAFGEVTGIGNVYPFAQAVHETGWFTSPRWVQANNPAGIGATDDSVWGNNFETISAGIFAQYAHLVAYGTDPNTGSQLRREFAKFSPRYTVLERLELLGCVKHWSDLGAKWAVSDQYGNRVVTIAHQIFGE